jgi:hypothetical protein
MHCLPFCGGCDQILAVDVIKTLRCISSTVDAMCILKGGYPYVHMWVAPADIADLNAENMLDVYKTSLFALQLCRGDPAAGGRVAAGGDGRDALISRQDLPAPPVRSTASPTMQQSDPPGLGDP